MSDCMALPDTVEEFMEQYKMTDTEHVYSNGTEFVPIFRMKQWFDAHPEPKKGWWIIWYEEEETFAGLESKPKCKCSICGKYIKAYEAKSTNYCSKCGAYMIGQVVQGESSGERIV